MLDLRERCTKMPSAIVVLDKLKTSAANMQPSVKSNPDKENEDVFTYKLSKAIFLPYYHFKAAAAALELFQQGQNMIFSPKNGLSPMHGVDPAGITQSFAVSCLEGKGRTPYLSSAPNVCKQLSLPSDFLSPQVSMMLSH